MTNTNNKALSIGPHTLSGTVILAPMAGITDRPFRQLCRELGAALAISEMVTSRPELWQSKKTRLRLDHKNEPAPISVQIAGADPAALAEAARFNVDRGAHMIDINMGCPAKKVCNVQAGSALLKDEKLVARILAAVVGAVTVPVTLKIRTGWSPEQRNAQTIAQIAESEGIQALTIHGRTRACAFKGQAEYNTIAQVKKRIRIPVIANGDIHTPEKALAVLRHTQVDGIMIGRAAQGNPWIFREINHYLATGEKLPPPSSDEVASTLVQHLEHLYQLYGESSGVRIARKHIAWYCQSKEGWREFWPELARVESAKRQIRLLTAFLHRSRELT